MGDVDEETGDAKAPVEEQEQPMTEMDSLPDVIDRICYVIWCLKIFVSLPMLVLYTLAALSFLGYFLYIQYMYVMAGLCAMWLTLLAIYYIFATNFKEFKKFMKKMMHRVLVDLPKNIVLEMAEDANKTVAELRQRAAEMGDHIDDHLDALHSHLHELGTSVHEDCKDQFHEVKHSLKSFLHLHKQKTKGKLEEAGDGTVEQAQA